MTHIIEVENIKCGGCVNSIRTALMKINGVENVVVDKDIETITIDSSEGKEIFVAALSKLGYPERGQNTVMKKAKSYVSCAAGKMV
jgi:copper chaperone